MQARDLKDRMSEASTEAHSVEKGAFAARRNQHGCWRHIAKKGLCNCICGGIKFRNALHYVGCYVNGLEQPVRLGDGAFYPKTLRPEGSAYHSSIYPD